MKKIVVADCETDPFKYGRIPEPFIWGVYDGDNYEQFYTTGEFIRYITDIDCICYAHNGGKFDWHFITEFIEFGTDLLIINGRLSRFTIGLCQFRDSYNILPVPLAAMEKTKIDYGIFEKSERDKKHNKKLIEAYLYDDCRFLYRFVMAFIDRFGLHLTQASAALKTWEKMSGRKAPNDKDGFIYDSFSKYYHGGRCEAFEHGIIEGEFSMVDINSAYPFAMLQNHPMGLIHTPIKRPTRHKWRGDEFLTVRGKARGALPFRGERGGLSFPRDGEAYEFNITAWEWLSMLETGHGAGYEILEAWQFLERANFKNFILPLYDERLAAKAAGDAETDLLTKLCMNSAYGKFGSNPRNYECFKVLDPEKIEPENAITGRDAGTGYGWSFAGYFGELALVSRPLYSDAERFYNVATSASITGYVRAMLWRAICRCEGVLYCDTDSIAARVTDALPAGDGLGAWKHEADFNGGGIGGKKLYAFRLAVPYLKSGETVTHKLASKGAKLTAPEIIDIICKGGTVNYSPIAPTFSTHKPPGFTERKIKMVIK